MTDRPELERRYRRWLAMYPKSFRAEHEDEMLGVLLEGAEPGQTRPRAGEALNLATHGLGRRRGGGFPGQWERRHANVMFPLRILIALWLAFISAMLLGFHRAEFWTLLTIPAMMLHLYIAYRIRPRTPATQ
jgi:hypothetical protein